MQVDSSNFRASPQPPGLVIEETVNTANTIDRAICILERATAQNLALMQVDASNFRALLQSLSLVIEEAPACREPRCLASCCRARPCWR